MQILLLISLLFALIVTVFALQNSAAVPVHVLFWNFRASLALIIIGSAFIGALVSSIFGFFRRSRSRDPLMKPNDPDNDDVKNGGNTVGTKDLAN